MPGKDKTLLSSRPYVGELSDSITRYIEDHLVIPALGCIRLEDHGALSREVRSLLGRLPHGLSDMSGRVDAAVLHELLRYMLRGGAEYTCYIPPLGDVSVGLEDVELFWSEVMPEEMSSIA